MPLSPRPLIESALSSDVTGHGVVLDKTTKFYFRQSTSDLTPHLELRSPRENLRVPLYSVPFLGDPPVVWDVERFNFPSLSHSRGTGGAGVLLPTTRQTVPRDVRLPDTVPDLSPSESSPLSHLTHTGKSGAEKVFRGVPGNPTLPRKRFEVSGTSKGETIWTVRYSYMDRRLRGRHPVLEERPFRTD